MFHFLSADMADDEPSAQDLTAIEAEGPVIRAELAVTDAEIVIAQLGQRVSELDWARLRLAERRLARVSRERFNAGRPMGDAA
ncbi:hypothetical protein Kisp02_01880 [Kineosporia sp. NBRC 101731]|nr:hypothetical protein Kisp02_01880 [Kineosporia sp. NBRC 101731]